MLPGILRFLLLIGALVFVHELGHFLVARWCGVKVLKFSLGFGPRVMGWRQGETDYCVSLIPFGGFVKMLGEDPGDDVLPEDMPRAFHAQALWRRFAIVLAGPLMSLLFPVLLYVLVFLGNTDLTPPLIGTVVPGYPAAGLLAPGDRVVSINGEAVGSFQEVRELVAQSQGRPLRFEVERGEARVQVRVTPEVVQVQSPLEGSARVGFLGIAPGSPLPVVGVRGPTTPGYIAGLRSFDLITMYRGAPVRRWHELEALLQRSRGATVPVAFLRPQRIERAAGGLVDLEVFDPGLAQLTPAPGDGDAVARTGIESPDLYLSEVDPDAPEYQMGLRRGDRVVSLDGESPPSWERFRERLTAGPARLRRLRFARNEVEAEGAYSLRPTVWTDETGQRRVRLSPGIDRWWPTAAEAPIPNPSPLLYAARNAARETREVVGYLSGTLVRIFLGRVPISSVGGPIMIYDASRSVALDGLWGYLRLMALVSINLGLLNLLPIPVLDGGHLLFFVVEAVIRRPVPLAVRQVAAALGMALLGALMVVALRNDVGRSLAPETAGAPVVGAPR